MTISNSDLLKIITHFLPGDPLSYKLRDDGSLVVIANTGKKHTFSADQVSAVYNAMKSMSKTTPKTPATKTSTAPKTTSKPKSTA